MKPVTITIYVFDGDAMVHTYEDVVHDTMFNVATIHVARMVRSINQTLTLGQDIRQVIVEAEQER